MPFQNWPRRVKNIVFLTFNISIKQRQQKKSCIEKRFQILNGCCLLAEHKGLCQPYNANQNFFCHCLDFTQIILYDTICTNLIPNQSTFVSASTILEVNKGSCAPGLHKIGKFQLTYDWEDTAKRWPRRASYHLGYAFQIDVKKLNVCFNIFCQICLQLITRLPMTFGSNCSYTKLGNFN